MHTDYQLPMDRFMFIDQLAGHEVITDRVSILCYPGMRKKYELRYQKIMKKLWDAFFLIEPHQRKPVILASEHIGTCSLENLIRRFDLVVKQAYPEIDSTTSEGRTARRLLFDLFNKMIILVELEQGSAATDAQIAASGLYISIVNDEIKEIEDNLDLRKLMK